MISTPATASRRTAPAVPRLVPAPTATSLAAHVAHFGPAPVSAGPALIDDVGRAGLRGRGGAGFPTAVKLAAVRDRNERRQWLRRGAVVVANGTEGEPASRKDATLLALAPHLVLDGVVASAGAVGADRALVCVERTNRATLESVRRALSERAIEDTGGVAIELAATPSRYVAGEESALVHYLNGGEAKPTLTPPRPFERGVGGRPTLVSNVETLAQVALIARFGPDWWRSVGTPDDPGSALLSLNGGVEHPGVYEIPLGVPLGSVLKHAGAGPARGVLIGGYFGTWLSPESALSARLTAADLARHGATLGCGVLAVVPSTVCPLAEVARVTRWLAGQSARQCGPCMFGLPAIADALDTVVAGDRNGRAEAAARRWVGMVRGRGACKLPDGVGRFVTSALDVFGEHLAAHRHGRTCPSEGSPVLPVPLDDGAWR